MSVSHGENTILLSATLYEREAISAAIYKLSNKCSILIESSGEKNTIAKISPFDGYELKSLINEFLIELADQQVRRDLNKQFGQVRELIVKQAFAPIANIKDVVDAE